MVGEDQFHFLNTTGNLAVHGWDDSAMDRLWRYNLHYFDDLNAQDAVTRLPWHRALLSRWVRENPPAAGTGWEPYPTSLRIVNWIKWALGGNVLSPECITSLAVQSRWLTKRLEYHLLGNHLFINGKALVFAGLFFNGPEAYSWLIRGLNILEREMVEQVLADGGQFERSTMYHALALEDVLDLCNLITVYPDAVPGCWQATVENLRDRVVPMRDWLAAMCHPDREIGFFNDAAIGVAPSQAEIDRYAQQLGFLVNSHPKIGVTHLVQSGYVRIESNDMVALLDVAPVGPDFLPAHAHADTLSFELSLFGQRFIVNSGTSCYGQGEERERQRGTAAHNTVVINGENSSEIWAGFRVGRRAYPSVLEVWEQGNKAVVAASHDGYQRLSGKNRHQRRWIFDLDEVSIEDEISGPFRKAEARFHFHPGVRFEHCIDDRQAIIFLPQGQRAEFIAEGGTLRQEPGSWYPQFGTSVPNVCLVVNFHGATVKTTIRWGTDA
jgi:uncharacterized heparinase superfamily protein